MIDDLRSVVANTAVTDSASLGEQQQPGPLKWQIADRLEKSSFLVSQSVSRRVTAPPPRATPHSPLTDFRPANDPLTVRHHIAPGRTADHIYDGGSVAGSISSSKPLDSGASTRESAKGSRTRKVAGSVISANGSTSGAAALSNKARLSAALSHVSQLPTPPPSFPLPQRQSTADSYSQVDVDRLLQMFDTGKSTAGSVSGRQKRKSADLISLPDFGPPPSMSTGAHVKQFPNDTHSVYSAAPPSSHGGAAGGRYESTGAATWSLGGAGGFSIDYRRTSQAPPLETASSVGGGSAVPNYPSSNGYASSERFATPNFDIDMSALFSRVDRERRMAAGTSAATAAAPSRKTAAPPMPPVMEDPNPFIVPARRMEDGRPPWQRGAEQQLARRQPPVSSRMPYVRSTTRAQKHVFSSRLSSVCITESSVSSLAVSRQRADRRAQTAQVNHRRQRPRSPRGSKSMVASRHERSRRRSPRRRSGSTDRTRRRRHRSYDRSHYGGGAERGRAPGGILSPLGGTPWGPYARPRAAPSAGMQSNALTPVASRSMLTCNREFQKNYPNVYQGLCKGLIDVNRLIAQEVVIPVKEEVSLHKSTIRSRWAVCAAISETLWRAVHGKFPDPKITPRLVRKVAEYFYDKIEAGVQEAEDERSLLQWLLRFDVENGIDVRVTTSMVSGANSVISNIEGAAHIRRRKGQFLGLISRDMIIVDLEVVIKALFLNGGQLAEINSDPMFSDVVMAGENRFAAQFLLPG